MKKHLIVFTIVLCLVLILSSIGIFASDSQKGTDGGQILRIIHPVLEDSWSPLNGGGDPTRWLSLQWASPMYFDSNGKIQPYVFSDWSGNADNTVWIFIIAENAVFFRWKSYYCGRCEGDLGPVYTAQYKAPAGGPFPVRCGWIR